MQRNWCLVIRLSGLTSVAWLGLARYHPVHRCQRSQLRDHSAGHRRRIRRDLRRAIFGVIVVL